jgi:hypothetical protein
MTMLQQAAIAGAAAKAAPADRARAATARAAVRFTADLLGELSI